MLQALVYPRFGGVDFLAQAASLVVFCNSYSIGVSMPRLEWRRRRLWKISMYSKIALASSTRVLQRRVSHACRTERADGGRDR